MIRRYLPALAVFAFALLVGASLLRPSSASADGPYKPVCPGTPAGVFCLQTDMYGTNMVPPVDTQAWGFYRFFFNAARTEADVTLDVKGLSQTLVTSADIRLGSPGSLGPVLYHLSDGGFIVTGVHMRFSQSDLQQLASGQWWVSISSQFHPDGEMRGQVILPPGFFPNTAPPPPGVSQQVSQPQQVIQQPPQQIPVTSVAPPPPLETLPPGVVPADPNAAPPGAAAAFQLYEECRGATVQMRISWVSSNLGPQWVDLSLYPDDFAEHDFISNGPVASGVNNVTWGGLIGSTWHYLRVNTLAQDGWVPSNTIAFYTRNDCR